MGLGKMQVCVEVSLQLFRRFIFLGLLDFANIVAHQLLEGNGVRVLQITLWICLRFKLIWLDFSLILKVRNSVSWESLFNDNLSIFDRLEGLILGRLNNWNWMIRNGHLWIYNVFEWADCRFALTDSVSLRRLGWCLRTDCILEEFRGNLRRLILTHCFTAQSVVRQVK